MRLENETKIDIVNMNLDSLRMNQHDSLITIDNKAFDLGMENLLENERYEDCSLMRDNKDLFVTDKKIVKLMMV